VQPLTIGIVVFIAVDWIVLIAVLVIIPRDRRPSSAMARPLTILLGRYRMPKRRPANKVAVPCPFHAAPAARLHRTSRAVGLLAAVAAAVAGLSLANVPAADATPGSGTYSVGASIPVPDHVWALAVDPFSGLTFTGKTGAVDVTNNYSASFVTAVPVGSATTVIFSIVVDPNRGLVWAADPENNSVYRIDESSMTVTATVPLSVAPKFLAVDHVTGKLFVTTATGGTVIPIDEEMATAATPLNLGGQPWFIAANADTGTLYVSKWDAASLVVIAESTLTVTATVALVVPVEDGMVVDKTHDKVYMTGPTGSTTLLTVVDGATDTTSSIYLYPGDGQGITSIAIDESTDTVFTASVLKFTAIDTTSGTVRILPLGNFGQYNLSAIGVDPYLNLLVVGEDSVVSTVTQIWEPISMTTQVPGLLAQGSPQSLPLTADAPTSVTWAVTSGSLPVGTALSSGTISGTPTATGTYTFALTSTDGLGDSVTQSYRQVVTGIDRVAGDDRFATSVAVSQAAYPSPITASTVYIANGYSFADALSAGPAATADHGPLMLTAPGYLPDVVKQEIQRLSPSTIVVVGGVNVVSVDVENQLKTLAATVVREAGADRYATARAVVRSSFLTASTVYIATGTNFPDSLSAGAAAGAHNAPLLLVNGGAASVDADTAALLRSLGTTTIRVIGGPAAVSDAMAQSLAKFGSVTRYYGGDRFGTSQAVNELSFSSAGTALLASGVNFPDALGASAWGGATGSPLFIAPNGCVPLRSLYDIYNFGVTRVSVVGGPSALSAGVTSLTACQSGWTAFALRTVRIGGEAPASANGGYLSALLDGPVPGHAVGSPRLRP
jgi:putative cell wall-binding protein